MSANAISTVERDGFQGTLYENPEKGTQFVAWQLATLQADHGKPVTVTGITGKNGSPKAAAYNLQHGDRGFLARVLASRRTVGRDGRSISVYIPGARVQVSGYDEALELNLRERVESTGDVRLAVRMMAGTVANVVARGVYALYAQSAEESAEEPEEKISEDITSIQF